MKSDINKAEKKKQMGRPQKSIEICLNLDFFLTI